MSKNYRIAMFLCISILVGAIVIVATKSIFDSKAKLNAQGILNAILLYYIDNREFPNSWDKLSSGYEWQSANKYFFYIRFSEPFRLVLLPPFLLFPSAFFRLSSSTLPRTTPEQAVEKLTVAGADIIGANCGQGIEGFIPICQRMRAVATLPLWMKANAGLPEIVDDKTVYRQTPECFAASAKELLAAGANFIVGCCGTTPEYCIQLRKIICK